MKKILIFLLGTILLISCTQEQRMTTWEVTKISGEVDTIQAKRYWILTPDSLFIVFEVSDTTKVIYSREGVEKFQRKN